MERCLDIEWFNPGMDIIYAAVIMYRTRKQIAMISIQPRQQGYPNIG